MVDETIKKLPVSPSDEWISTYTALTANGILQRLGVKLPDALVPYQLHEIHSFYRKLVRLPALNAFNDLIRTQCRDIQAYSQQQVIEYLFSGEADKPDSAPGAELRNKIETDREALLATGRTLTQLEQEHFQLMEDTNRLLRNEVSKWQDLVTELTEKTWDLLNNHGLTLNIKFKARLRELFDLQAAGVALPQEMLQSLKIKQLPSPWLKGLIKLLVEVEADGN